MKSALSETVLGEESLYYFYFENSNSNMDFFFKLREDVMTHENVVLMKKVEIFAVLNFISRII